MDKQSKYAIAIKETLESIHLVLAKNKLDEIVHFAPSPVSSTKPQNACRQKLIDAILNNGHSYALKANIIGNQELGQTVTQIVKESMHPDLVMISADQDLHTDNAYTMSFEIMKA